MNFNLIVLRSSDPANLSEFYEALLERPLLKHSHGKGPEHFGCELGAVVSEIYPQRNEQDLTSTVRFGLQSNDIDDALKRVERFGIKIVSPPKDSEWGRRAVIDDPEGHRIELTEAQ